MKPAPIISVINSATPAQVKSGNAGTPEQSFGQVLAQQVQSGAQANKTAPAQPAAQSGNHSQNNAQANSTANAGAGQSTDGSSASSSSGTATGTTAGSTAGSASGSTPNGKTGKTKSAHGQDDSNSSTANNIQTNAATDASANNSAQILALVSNVQQAAATSGATTDATSAVSTQTGSVGTTSAQAALANFQASIAGTGDAAGVTAATTVEKSALPDAFNKELVKNLDSQGSSVAATTTAATQQTAQDVNATSQAPLPALPALDLAASAEKNLQAGLASLDDAAAKTVAALQSATSAASAAAPGIVTMAQTNLAAQVSTVADKLEPQVGSNGWDTSLGQKVVWMAAGGQQSASLTLNPPDLGPMQVVLNVTNSHATVNFTAAQPEVRQALENALPKLREMLGDAGIQLGQASVNAGNAQQQQFAEQSAHKSSSRMQSIDAMDAAAPIAATVTRTTSAGIGLVDTFA